MNELILQDHPEFLGLIDLGSCTIHTVHNAFGKGMEQFGKEMINFVWILKSLFQFSATRQKDLYPDGNGFGSGEFPTTH